MEPSIATDTTYSTNTSHISHGDSAGQRLCFDVCIQTDSVKIEVLQSNDYSCMVSNGPIPVISAANAAGALLLSGMRAGESHFQWICTVNTIYTPV